MTEGPTWSGKYSMDCLHHGSSNELILHYVQHAISHRGHEAHAHCVHVHVCVFCETVYECIYVDHIL